MGRWNRWYVAQHLGVLVVRRQASLHTPCKLSYRPVFALIVIIVVTLKRNNKLLLVAEATVD